MLLQKPKTSEEFLEMLIKHLENLSKRSLFLENSKLAQTYENGRIDALAALLEDLRSLRGK